MRARTMKEAFEHHGYTIVETGCWLWNGPLHALGYGYMNCVRRHYKVFAHRASLILKGVDIPKGLVVRHKCDTPQCVNPDHLCLGTQAENIADMIARGRHWNKGKYKTHCINGHPLTEENTYRNTDGYRRCLLCHRRRSRESYYRKRDKRGALRFTMKED